MVIVDTIRGLNRTQFGPSLFDALPFDARCVGALIFDGHMAELHPSIDCGLATDVVNQQLAQRKLGYQVVTKPNFGLEDPTRMLPFPVIGCP